MIDDKYLTDNMLDMADLEELKELSIIKRHIMSLFNDRFLVNLIVKIIDESECINFLNERSRKISPINIAFTLAFSPKKCVDKYGGIDPSSSNDEKIDYLNNVIEQELINVYITELIETIKGNENYLKNLNKDLCDLTVFRDDIREDTVLNAVTFSTLFSIYISDDFKTAHVYYVK